MSEEDIEEIEEAEEAEEIEELEDVESESQVFIGEDILKRESIKIWRKSYENSPSPSILINDQLQIVWLNRAFSELFGDSKHLIGKAFINYYSAFADRNTLTDIARKLYSKNAGYSWYGRIESKNKNSISVITKLLIVPLFDSVEHEKPIAYGGVYNDISSEYKELLKNTFQSLLEAARLKDNDTGNHIERVNRYSKRLAEALVPLSKYPQVDNEFIENIGYLAAMHDVGKIGTPDDILNKQGPLEDWEWEIMKEHTINGAYILSTYPNPMAREIALRHHEWWNGAGYPHGLSGDLIPLSARIVTIADVYDALRMERSYKKAFSHEKAKSIISEEKGSHFDPNLIDIFEKIEGDFREIYEELND